MNEIIFEYMHLLDIMLCMEAELEDGDQEELSGEIRLFFDKLNEVEGDFSAKAERYAAVIMAAKSDIEAIEAEVKRLEARKKRINTLRETLKTNLHYAFEQTGKTALSTPLYSFRIQKNPPSVKVDDVQALKPLAEYWKPYKFSDDNINKKLILDLWRDTGEVPAGCHVEQKLSLRIK